MTDIERRLTTHLDAFSDSHAVINPPVGVLIQQAKRRQYRRRRAGVAGVSLLIAGAAIGAFSLRASNNPDAVRTVAVGEDGDPIAPTVDEERSTAVGPVTVTDTAPTEYTNAPRLVPSPLRWTQRDVAHPVGVRQSQVISGLDGVLYALATAPSAHPGSPEAWQQAIYRSLDGIEWTDPIALTEGVVNGGRWSRNLGVGSSDRLYSVSTAALNGPITAASPAGDLVVQVSDDVGQTWSAPEALPGIDFRELRRTSVSLGYEPGPSSHSALGTVLTIRVTAPLATVTPPNDADVTDGWSISEAGLTAHGLPSEKELMAAAERNCPVGDAAVKPTVELGYPDAAGIWVCSSDRLSQRRSVFSIDGHTRLYPWEELGVPSDRAALARGDVMTYLASPVPDEPMRLGRLPASESSRTVVGATADDDGFELIVLESSADGHFSLVLYSSLNGTVWMRGIETEINGWPLQTIEVAGRISVVVEGDERQFWTAAEDGWRMTSVIPIPTDPEGRRVQYRGIGHVASGEAGVVVVMTSAIDALADAGGLEIILDGYAYRQDGEQMPPYVVELATGTAIDDLWRSPRTKLDENGGVAILDRDGNTLVEFSGQSISAALEAIYVENLDSLDEHPGDLTVMFSPDGVTWSAIAAGEIAGEPVAEVTGLVSTPGGFAVTVILERGASDGGRIAQVYEATIS